MDLDQAVQNKQEYDLKIYDTFERTKQTLAGVVNEAINVHGLPIYLVAIGLKELYTEAQAQVNLEYQQYIQQQQSQIPLKTHSPTEEEQG